MSPLKAMVLSAGLGTRLRPLTHILPKPLVPVANRPLIAYNFALLEKAGVRQVAVNLHHLGEKIQEVLKDGSDYGLEITYSPEDPILGTGGGLMRVRSFLQGERFCLLNGDVLCGVDLEEVLRFHRERNAAATMVVGPLPPGATYTPLLMDAEGWLVELKDARRKPVGETRQVMFLGVHVLEPEVFDFLPAVGFSCINNQAYTAMMKKGLDVAAYFHSGFWYDLGTPASYLAANLSLLSGRVRPPRLDPLEGASPDGVLLGDGVQLGEGVKLGPEVAVGDRCVIGDGTQVSRSVIWAGEDIAPGVSLDRKIVAGGQVLRG
ncbi:sugar phosphate nucleotidyltransferase [Myxococcota bacterium]